MKVSCFLGAALGCTAILASADTATQLDRNLLSKKKPRRGGGRKIFLKPQSGLALGRVNMPAGTATFAAADQSAIKSAAKSRLRNILKMHFDATGKEVIQPTEEKVHVDGKGNRHVRFQQYVRGFPVEGASLMLHFNKKGQVTAVNGEFSSEKNLDPRVKMDCKSAMKVAVAQAALVNIKVLSKCENAAVRGEDGNIYLAYKQMFSYQPQNKPTQTVLVFASKVDGDLVTIHPQDRGALALETYDCGTTTNETKCALKSKSTSAISQSDLAVTRAHNYAIDTWKFFNSTYGRDSLDGKGLVLKSYVHWDVKYMNAYWNGYGMFYGDGDGSLLYPFSYALDVVAHELCHGLTQFTSNLVYKDESGAINEALSDMFGSTIENLVKNKSEKDTWLLAEDLFINGGAVRDMADPAAYGNVDYYPDRFTGTEDYGGVHTNSGIANLFYALMVSGGKHPRGKTTNVVPAIDPSNFQSSLRKANSIIYDVQVGCLTQSSDYAAMRECTVTMAPSAYLPSITGAWDAVGVAGSSGGGGGGGGVIALTNAVAQTKQSALLGSTQDYSLAGVLRGETVTCSSTGGTGDADLYVKFANLADPIITSSNACQSWARSTNEEICTTGVASSATDVYMALYAYADYTGVSTECYRTATKVLLSGANLYHQSVGNGKTNYYSLEGIKYGDTLTCSLSGGKGEANLFVRFETLPVLFDTSVNGCESTKAGTAQSCTATFKNTLYQGETVTANAFVGVYGMADSSEMTLLCTRGRAAKTATMGTAVTGLKDVRSGVINYQLKNVATGTAVTCSLNGNNGDADLYVRFGKTAEPYHWSLVNDCESTNPTAIESCTTGPSMKITTANVAIVAFANYTDLTLDCSASKVCQANKEACTARSDCCVTSTSELTCDAKACTACKKATTACTRDTQCCSGMTCQSQTCQV